LKIVQEAFYLEVNGGECFAVHRAPYGLARAVILHLPAFGDEMNKARAMTARASRTFAQAGYGVLQVDWLGCGDSTGDHSEATLRQWLENADAAIQWLRERHPRCPLLGFWALRAGALLLPALTQSAPDALVLLWQPVISGTQQLSQLLRVRVSAAVTNAAALSSAKALREQLRAGGTLELGGYAVSSALAAELDSAAFHVPPQHRAPITWFEVSPSGQRLSDIVTKLTEEAARSGVRVHARVVTGPTFWQSVEIEQCDELIARSTAMLDEMVHEISRAAAVL
jgi:exosortase A-associated hydrolase 2